MPHLVALRGAAAVAGLVLAALPTLPAAQASASARSAEVHDRCTPEEITVVVDFNELAGPTSRACAEGPATAAEAFEASGFPLAYARAPGMQGFVCSVAGKPAKGPCTEGDAYWSLWWSAPPAPGREPQWAYATLGAGHLELERGSYVGFAWHEGDVDAEPPDVAIPITHGTDRDPVVTGAESAVDDEADDGGVPTWVFLGAAAVVLGGAGAVPLLRRRSR